LAYDLSFWPPAYEALKKMLEEMKQKERERLRVRIKDLETEPEPVDCEPLQEPLAEVIPAGHQSFEGRTLTLYYVYEGYYQIIYEVSEENNAVEVVWVRDQEHLFHNT
jgi:hypothetical protein